MDIALWSLGPEYWPDILTAPPVVSRGLPWEGLEGDRVTTPHTWGGRGGGREREGGVREGERGREGREGRRGSEGEREGGREGGRDRGEKDG